MRTSPARRRRSRSRPADAPALDRRAILHAALQLVDAEGLAALSMRRLGARLGVEAMTLYYYVPGKAALVQGLAEVVLDELQLPSGPVHAWQTAVREVARSFRRLGLVHPNVFPLLATVGLDNPASFRPTEAILRLLGSAGFAPELAFTAFTTIKSFVVGHVLWILGDRLLGQGGERLPPPQAAPPEMFPRLASYLPYLASCDPEAEFERGLDVLVAGLEALLGAGPEGA
jgi:AcrR family transcriptional regulator